MFEKVERDVGLRNSVARPHDDAVVTAIDPLLPAEPIVFPSPEELPPIVIPEPFVSIPIKASEPAAVGTEETDIAAITFPLMLEAGVALVVVNNIPW